MRSSLTGPCVKILQMPCLTVACMGALVDGSRKVLVSSSSSSKSFYDDLVRFSSGSWHEDLAQGFLHVIVRRSCGDPVYILLKRSLHEVPMQWCLYDFFGCSNEDLV